MPGGPDEVVTAATPSLPPPAKSNGRRRRVWRALRFGSLAILLTLLGVEVVLQSLGLVVSSRRHTVPPAAAGVHRVLCVGDSFTFGIGASSPGNSYPARLQALLGERYQVINEGWPGSNSSQVAERLPALVEKYHPEITLVMTGMNNHDNPMGSTLRTLRRAGYIDDGPRVALLDNFDRLLWNLALYRWVRWSAAEPRKGALMFESVKAPFERDAAYQPEAPFAPLRDDVKAAWQTLSEAKEDGSIHLQVVALEGLFSKVHTARELNGPLINELKRAHEILTPRQYREILDVLRASMPAEDFEQCINDHSTLQRRSDIAEKVLWYDLAKIQEICAKGGAELVVMSYPFGGYRGTYSAFSMVHHVPFIDNLDFEGAAIFSQSQLKNEGHLNDRGYSLLAEHIFAKGRELGEFVAGR